ncbi:phosphoribosylformylglycinamidine cyclo-ligase [Marinihelvus fidelis]|uniref:Phosphoribosylformylglycinamidine cyclo-ligase n=1 Tax=Marinihelvus fidelis TaxID=2613842 RepID=A0A5N0TEF1_9GAMM|nr:phosphoribosylformylglycinamidine cyclo-ligase [Marinihelvus fidelis]KAA9133412.1 phosphoribosylformylglycinamidine cyclo-ligase [Marinihelvus fidelis]
MGDATNPDQPLSYRDAGVDIDAGNALVERIKPAVKTTFRKGVETGIGGFGGLFSVDRDKYRDPVLVSGTDGVGTKLMLARLLDRHDTIGIDLVAMCVNDILACGAEPLFFLDYFATGKLELDQAQQVIEGIAEGCRQSNCALLGGETAEMPGMYGAGDYDLAGFAVGVVERDRIIDGRRVAAGHRLLALPSSGPHSNGYSLIRKVLERSGADPSMALGDHSLGEALLAPTRIYARTVLALLEDHAIDGLAHITGGGITENITRVLGDSLGIEVDTAAWPRPDVFDWLQREGGIEATEMLRTFNCGIGMVLLVDGAEADTVSAALQDMGEDVFDIGRVVTVADDGERVRYL